MIKYFVIRNFSGTCSFVEMLRGYIVRERLETPGLDGLALSCDRQWAHFQ